MADKMEDKWDEAFASPGTKILIGDTVVCDVCSKDWTESDVSGGFIFGSYAYCPDCADRLIDHIRDCGEDHLIRAFCPEGKSFADFVREYRGPDASVWVDTV